MKVVSPPNKVSQQSIKSRTGIVDRAAKNLLTKALSSMNMGRMHLQTPEGVWHRFGKDNELLPAIIKIRNNRFWLSCVLFGDIGFAESYMRNDWNTPDLKAVISWFILNNKNSPLLEDSKQRAFWANLLGSINYIAHKAKPNSVKGSKKNIEQHYDLSNELFSLFLDRSMTYSSAKFSRTGQSLEDAQLEKMDSLCKKLQLRPEDRLLEIGTGWGALAIHAASRYGCHVTTVTISSKQYYFAKRNIAALGLSNNIEILLQDYRSIKGKYNKIVSVEMIEAVGEEYLDIFFATIHKLLAEDGLLAMQMITCPDNRYKIMRHKVDFIQKHIFPGGAIPSLGRIVQSINRTGSLSIFEVEDFGMSYVKTLDSWYERFNAQLDQVTRLGFDDSFIRKWNYYLQYCSAAFEMRNVSVVQAVFTRPNNTNLSKNNSF